MKDKHLNIALNKYLYKINQVDRTLDSLAYELDELDLAEVLKDKVEAEISILESGDALGNSDELYKLYEKFDALSDRIGELKRIIYSNLEG